MDQSSRPFDVTEPTYTTDGFLNAITGNLVITAGPEPVESPYHETWILKKIAGIQPALIGPPQQWYLHLRLEMRKTGQCFAEKSRSPSITNNCKHKRNYC